MKNLFKEKYGSMQYNAWVMGVLLLLSIAACDTEDKSKLTLAITNVNVVDVESGSLLENQLVLIASNRIQSIIDFKDASIPDSLQVLDGGGGFLIPGLWDTHVHLVTERNWTLPMMLAYGITGVRNMHTTEPDPLGVIRVVKEEVKNNEYSSPRFIANGPILEEKKGTNSWQETVQVGTEEEARAAVDSLADGGADFIKVYDNLTEDLYLIILDQAAKKGIPVDGHLPLYVDALKAAEAGQRTIEHTSGITAGCSAALADLRAVTDKEREDNERREGPVAFAKSLRKLSDGYDETLCQEFIKKYAETGITVVPTLINGWAGINAKYMVSEVEAMKYLPSGTRAFYNDAAFSPIGEQMTELMEPVVSRSMMYTKKMHDAGIPILAGTDIGNPFLIPGQSLHKELELLQESGLSPAEVLRTATINPSRTFGFSDSLGLIRKGFLADLVLLSDNPLESAKAVNSIKAVIRNGDLYDRTQLDSILSDIEQKHRE